MSKKIAVCQMTSVAEKDANLEVVSRLVSDAAKEKAEVSCECLKFKICLFLFCIIYYKNALLEFEFLGCLKLLFYNNRTYNLICLPIYGNGQLEILINSQGPFINYVPSYGMEFVTEDKDIILGQEKRNKLYDFTLCTN